MTTLYDLQEAQKELLYDLEFCDGDEEKINKRLNDIQGQMRAKIEFVASIYAETKKKAEAMRQIAQEQQKRAQAMERVEERLKAYIISGLKSLGEKKIDSRLVSVSTYVREKVGYADGFNAQNLPKHLVKVETTYTPKATEIKEALHNGEEVTGCFIDYSDVLRVL